MSLFRFATAEVSCDLILLDFIVVRTSYYAHLNNYGNSFTTTLRVTLGSHHLTFFTFYVKLFGSNELARSWVTFYSN